MIIDWRYTFKSLFFSWGGIPLLVISHASCSFQVLPATKTHPQTVRHVLPGHSATKVSFSGIICYQKSKVQTVKTGLYIGYISTLEVQPPFLVRWFPNHHYFSSGLSSSNRNHNFFNGGWLSGKSNRVSWRWVWGYHFPTWKWLNCMMQLYEVQFFH